MKTVLMIRHAKSSWSDLSLKDFDRPLNDRGEGNAALMAKRLDKKKLGIDYFITSPALRAQTTASIMAKELGIKKSHVLFVPSLYEPTVHAFYSAIASAPDDANTIAVVSHNPGITDFVNTLTTTRMDDMPTAAIFAVTADTNDWAGFSTAEKKFLFYDQPKS
jgi:phosphohistidine phosphatase